MAMNDKPEIQCDLLVIGSGMTGMAATLFAANRGIDIVQVGLAGEMGFASGFFDLLGVHPASEGHVWDNPWEGIDALIKSDPRHPYALMKKKEMQAAFSDITSFLATNGLPYQVEPDRNLNVITPVGTIKTTYAIPISAQNGVKALAEKAPCLIVDFKDLKGFSGRQIVETLKKTWPALTTQPVSFPDSTGELLAEHMALSLERPKCREQLADAILPHLDSIRYVGLPAILGLYQPMAVFDDLQQRLNRPIFEIPLMPPAIGGLRLRNCFEQALPRLGVRTHYQQKILSVDYLDSHLDSHLDLHRGSYGFRFNVGRNQPRHVISAKGVILASGRFIGGGLTSDRKQVSEALFNLPVYQPVDRTKWHRKSFLDPKGHPINRFGIMADDHWRPLGKNGKPMYSGLFAAGSILAHQDWVRQKCGAGLAITTAHAAVNACHRFIESL